MRSKTAGLYGVSRYRADGIDFTPEGFVLTTHLGYESHWLRSEGESEGWAAHLKRQLSLKVKVALPSTLSTSMSEEELQEARRHKATLQACIELHVDEEVDSTVRTVQHHVRGWSSRRNLSQRGE